MLQFIDLGEPVSNRIENALTTAGKAFTTNYSDLRAPFTIEGVTLNFADAADLYLPGGWDSVFAEKP
jgi:hypothetical protein